MTNLPTSTIDIEQVQRVLLTGDLSTLRPEQKVQYYNKVCELVGLNPLTKPFDYLKLNGKEVLYANKGCGEQLRMRHKISLKISSREKIDDVYVVTAEAIGTDGRVDSSTGVVPLKGLSGDALANALMKAETKAKRRVTLSICGLNMLDETEVETIVPAEKPNQILMDQPGPEDGVTDTTTYTIQFGKWRNRTLEQVARDHGLHGKGSLGDYVVYLENAARDKRQALDGVAKEFVDRASEFIASMENAPLHGLYPPANELETMASEEITAAWKTPPGPQQSDWTPPPEPWRPPYEPSKPLE